MSDKTKGILCVIMFGLSCMVIGMYLVGGKPVQPHQWVLTSCFGLYFLSCGIDKLNEKG